MIEIEKKFQPTEEQLKAMLEGAEFLGEVVNHDQYYDYGDLRFFREDSRLRKRNGVFEFKFSLNKDSKHSTKHNEETTNVPDILEKLGFERDSDLDSIVNKNMQVFCDIKTVRKAYQKGEFTLDLDETDFGYNMCEIEICVEDESKIKEAEEKILAFAKSFGLELKKLPGKMAEYFRLLKPEIYKEFYGNK